MTPIKSFKNKTKHSSGLEFSSPVIQNVLDEYKQMLLGTRKRFSKEFFAKASDSAAEEHLFAIIKYLIENILIWTPEEAYQYLTVGILNKFKINNILISKAVFPKTLHGSKTQFLIEKLYGYSELVKGKQHYKDTFLECLKLKRDLPKNFFSGIDGRDRAIACLKIMINREFVVTNISELYYFFSTKKINVLLRTYNLQKCCESHFENPLQFLHFSLSEKQRSSFLYNAHRFLNEHKKELSHYFDTYVKK